MVATFSADDAAETVVLAGAGAAWERLHTRIAHRFGRVEVRARVRRYLAGILARVERKHGWQRAEAIGEGGPPGVQRLLRAAVWDAAPCATICAPMSSSNLATPRAGSSALTRPAFPRKTSTRVASPCNTAARWA